MRLMRRAGLLVALLFSVAALASAADRVDPEEARKAIEAVNAAIGKAVQEGEAASFASHYSEDAALLAPDREIVRGRKQIEQFWKETIEGGLKQATLQTVEVENLGDTAWELGTADLVLQPRDQPAVTQKVKYVVVWKRQTDGAWKLHRDIWNTLAAAPEP